MKKHIILTTIVLMLMTTLVLSVPAVLAGNMNRNQFSDETFPANDAGKSIERGTGKLNGIDGCAPPTQSGNVLVNMDISSVELFFINLMLADVAPGTPYWQINSEDGSVDWMGGPCCPSNELAANGNPLPNQCCNGPDMGLHGVPGNHCICFELRGYPIPEAATFYPNPA